VRRISGNSNRRRGQWIVVELNLQTLQQRILPDLAERYFTGVDGLDYMIAVVAESAPRRVVYSSDPDFATRDVPDADGRMDVFGDVRAKTFGSPIRVFHKLSQNAGLSGLAASIGSSWFPLIGEPAETQGWQLIVRHRRGGALGAFVAEMHRRDLALSFGVLLLLVISVAMLVVTSQRARRLAKLQMEFVTAVSHELRSPLAIISSAAENIAEGVVDTGPQVTQYGSVIERQARRLSRLVEEILLFAATSENRHRYIASELDVNEIIDAALAATADLIQASRFTIEREIPTGLPSVGGDRFALSQSLQNLITNALKYGGPERWIGIRTSVHGEDAIVHGEIRIDVSDHGMGIEATDLPHIFEPFYRSPSVTAAQIYGTGLGLSLAKSIAEAMGGRLTVVSLPHTGSTFTLHLPFAQPLVNANQDSAGDARRQGRLDDPLRAAK
jgi:signal transduction histidine kinase